MVRVPALAGPSPPGVYVDLLARFAASAPAAAAEQSPDGITALRTENEAIVLRTVSDQPTLWDAILPSELLVLPRDWPVEMRCWMIRCSSVGSQRISVPGSVVGRPR